MFTTEQYDQAIEALQNAKQQHIDGTTNQGCSVCGGDCHPDICGFNPLYAMYVCCEISRQSSELHETLHTMSGFNTYMGSVIGPSRIVLPKDTNKE